MNMILSQPLCSKMYLFRGREALRSLVSQAPRQYLNVRGTILFLFPQGATVVHPLYIPASDHLPRAQDIWGIIFTLHLYILELNITQKMFIFVMCNTYACLYILVSVIFYNISFLLKV